MGGIVPLPPLLSLLETAVQLDRARCVDADDTAVQLNVEPLELRRVIELVAVEVSVWVDVVV